MSAFDAFGLSHAHTADGLGSASYDPVGFGGQFGYYHDYQGRYLLGHRYYDALAGRFLTRDPIGYKGGINLYGFTGNNPVNESDPDGYSPASTLEEVEQYITHHTTPAVRRFGGYRVFRMSVRPLPVLGAAGMTVGLFFMSQTRIADDSMGPVWAAERRAAIEKSVKRNRGRSLDREGYYQFPNRQAARQAASEVAGDLGSSPIVLRVKNYRGVPRNLSNSNTVMGRESSTSFPTGGSVAGWRDDFLGHDQFGAGPHVNVWRNGRMLHFHY